MKQKRQLFSVGDLCVDILQEISNGLEFGEEHALKGLDFSIGGNAANFAVIASKLCLNPKLISAVGKDFATGYLLKELANAGVQHSLIRSKQPNAFSIISVNKRGERAIQSVKNCESELTSKRVGKMLLPGLKQNDIVFFGGFYHLRKMRPGFRQLLQEIKKRKAIVCFDTCFDTHGMWDISSFLPFIDYLFVNDIELKHIAHGRTMQQRADSLFRNGAHAIAVKQAGSGATLFVKGFKEGHFPSVAKHVLDTTAAGDAFNAGFVLGLMRGWSLDNCMRAANFVAARKVQQHGLAGPSSGAVERFVAIHNEPTLVVVRNHGEMSKIAAQRVINLVKRKPAASIALPAGETPKQLYRLLVQAYRQAKADFSKASFFGLDEYVGLNKEDRNSFSFYLMHHLLSKVNARKKNIHLLDGSAKSLRKEAAAHEASIKRKGIDLCILGIGVNGHVAFNEPGSCPYGITRLVKLKQETRKANGKNFSGGMAPAKALTIGLRTIGENSGKILLLASGKRKRTAILNTLKSKDFMRWPSVSLKQHRNFMIVADGAASRGVE